MTRPRLVVVLAVAALFGTPANAEEPSGVDQNGADQDGSQLIDIGELDPTIALDIRYATDKNLTGTVLYDAPRCLLRRAVAERLVKVQARLKKRDLGLKMWDCYRPISVQKRLWQLVKNARYVARPVFRNGRPVRGSRHNRGAAVDVTLVDSDQRDVSVPTDHDDFSRRAHSNYKGGSRAGRANARRLRRAMIAEGFTPIASEWWHFDGPGWRSYELEDRPLSP